MNFEMELLAVLGKLTDDEAKKKFAFDAIVKKVNREQFTEDDRFGLLQSLRLDAIPPPERRRDFDEIVRDAIAFPSVASGKPTATAHVKVKPKVEASRRVRGDDRPKRPDEL